MFNGHLYHVYYIIKFYPFTAPSGCLQYYFASSGIIRSFNYSPSPNSLSNSIGVDGSRQIANLNYGICIKATASCSITYRVLSSDVYSFTMTGDVGAVDPALLSTGTLQEQLCMYLLLFCEFYY